MGEHFDAKNTILGDSCVQKNPLVYKGGRRTEAAEESRGSLNNPQGVPCVTMANRLLALCTTLSALTLFFAGCTEGDAPTSDAQSNRDATRDGTSAMDGTGNTMDVPSPMDGGSPCSRARRRRWRGTNIRCA